MCVCVCAGGAKRGGDAGSSGGGRPQSPGTRETESTTAASAGPIPRGGIIIILIVGER